MKSLASFALIAVLSVGPAGSFAQGRDGYFCTTDHATGFAFNKAKKQWGTVTFQETGKFLITRASPAELKNGNVWVVKKVGSSSPDFVCQADFNDFGYLNCKGLTEFIFNRKNNRFLSSYMIGYVSDAIEGNEAATALLGPEGSNTPAMQIGRCSPL